MMVYWDSSALIDALEKPEVRDKLSGPNHFTRVHTLAEVFSTLTGGRLRFRCLPDDALEMIEELSRDLVFVELGYADTFAALRKAQQLGVQGGRVHDLLHVAAAQKAKADKIWTLNLSDFKGLDKNIVIEAP
jgi:predicted nucleic acid-binding protein